MGIAVSNWERLVSVQNFSTFSRMQKQTIMRNLTLTFLLLGFAVFSLAQDNGLPPNPQPGKCYVRCITPDVWENKEVRVLVKPAHSRLEVVPAVYKTVEERILVKPASKKFVYVPATYRTERQEMRVEDTYNDLSVVPASFAPDSEEIVVQPSYASFEYQRAMENCESDGDCLTLCYVEHPEQTTTIATETLSNDARTTSQVAGGRVITIVKEVEVTPARYDEIDIPAEYRTIEKRVLVTDETTRKVPVEAVYRTETTRVLQQKGGVAVWEEIDCSLTGNTILPIFYELGSARLTSESRRIIDERLYNLMREKSNIRVEINSHTDSRGSSSSNQDLSQRRAQSVVNYLVAKGINRSRLVARGYGESRLVNNCKDGVNCTEAQHRKNRRTEFRVLSN